MKDRENLRRVTQEETYPLIRILGLLGDRLSSEAINKNGFPMGVWIEFLTGVNKLTANGLELIKEIGSKEQLDEVLGEPFTPDPDAAAHIARDFRRKDSNI